MNKLGCYFTFGLRRFSTDVKPFMNFIKYAQNICSQRIVPAIKRHGEKIVFAGVAGGLLEADFRSRD